MVIPPSSNVDWSNNIPLYTTTCRDYPDRHFKIGDKLIDRNGRKCIVIEVPLTDRYFGHLVRYKNDDVEIVESKDLRYRDELPQKPKLNPIRYLKETTY